MQPRAMCQLIPLSYGNVPADGRFPGQLASSPPPPPVHSEICSADSHIKWVLAAILESHSHKPDRGTVRLKPSKIPRAISSSLSLTSQAAEGSNSPRRASNVSRICAMRNDTSGHTTRRSERCNARVCTSVHTNPPDRENVHKERKRPHYVGPSPLQ